MRGPFRFSGFRLRLRFWLGLGLRLGVGLRLGLRLGFRFRLWFGLWFGFGFGLWLRLWIRFGIGFWIRFGFGFLLINRDGARGSTLTEDGLRLVEVYKTLQEEAGEFVNKRFRELI